MQKTVQKLVLDVFCSFFFNFIDGKLGVPLNCRKDFQNDYGSANKRFENFLCNSKSFGVVLEAFGIFLFYS
jgi:hypothetical protein